MLWELQLTESAEQEVEGDERRNTNDLYLGVAVRRLQDNQATTSITRHQVHANDFGEQQDWIKFWKAEDLLYGLDVIDN